MRKSWGSKIDPMLRDHRRPYNTRAIIAACRPYDWIEEFPRVAQASPALLRATRDKWAKIFSDPRFPLPEGAIGNAEVDTQSQGTQTMT